MLLQASEESERRTLTIVGAAVVLCIVAVAGQLIVFNPFGGRPKDEISVAIDTPYVGQGVTNGTAVLMHGVKVGKVTAIKNLPQGGVRLDADLQTSPTAGLTDKLNIDFRPVNYFGVTGINLIAGTGGQALRDGIQINTVPTGNFTLQALLSRLGQLSSGVLTPQLIQVIDRATRYTDALDPLIDTVLIAATAVAEVQTVPTARLLTNTTGLTVALPSFVDAATDAGDRFDHTGIDDTITEDEFQHRMLPSVTGIATGLFSAIGKLEGAHVDDLFPAIEATKTLTDVVPGLIRPEAVQQTLIELRTRFEKMYAGTPEQRALQVRIVLDSLPGVAAPLGLRGGPR